MEQHYLDTLARFICDARLTDLDEATLRHGRWVIADSIPVVAAGMQVPEMKTFASNHLAQAAAGHAWVLGTGQRAAPLDAGLLNGSAGCWLELDEGNQFAKGHPGIQVVPAALAVAQETGASGADLLLATILGYEVSSRINRAGNMRLSIHPHGTYGVIGAAIAVGKLRGLDATRMRDLISMSATMGMSTSRNTLLEGSTVRNIYTGHSAYMGQIAARMAQAGFKGERDGVESVYGKGVVSDSYDAASVMHALGQEWLITMGYFKLHPTGRYVHTAIDALEDALAQVGGRLDAGSVERIDVKGYRLAAMLNGKAITTSFGGRFSIPFALATILHHGHSGLLPFEDAAVANTDVQALVQRVYVEEDAAYTAVYPGLQRCDVTIRFKDGRPPLVGHCEMTKGEHSRPHTQQELQEKFMSLGNPIWGESVTSRLFDACMRIEAISDMREFSKGYTL
ncbi:MULTISPECIES: MmgE/PrpD family protein [unclassified Achromobacter]|uniref:MmgE/PrpD family protein n=1 Tax=unclassified Achromobacter TaxID=2626865 RepID=UPI000B516E40|nr:MULTISPECIES: MmgE/PrpD family protein [unclassified Achromobacter]OWT73774.1 2-methylcitrate dehydratase [Achromobacter sp. HZ34]OWT79310.1 2-methylcitrate dehydratase [Achromobacter sp. HZ28]